MLTEHHLDRFAIKQGSQAMRRPRLTTTFAIVATLAVAVGLIGAATSGAEPVPRGGYVLLGQGQQQTLDLTAPSGGSYQTLVLMTALNRDFAGRPRCDASYETQRIALGGASTYALTVENPGGGNMRLYCVAWEDASGQRVNGQPLTVYGFPIPTRKLSLRLTSLGQGLYRARASMECQVQGKWQTCVRPQGNLRTQGLPIHLDGNCARALGRYELQVRRGGSWRRVRRDIADENLVRLRRGQRVRLRLTSGQASRDCRNLGFAAVEDAQSKTVRVR